MVCTLHVVHLVNFPSVLDQNTRRTQKLTDYLPSSLENLEEMGRLLTYNDSTCDTQTLAKFVLTTTKAPFDKLYKEIRPVFVIPAFCETQIRPLISKLMYPCFVAHIKPDVPTVNQVALHLLKVITRILMRIQLFLWSLFLKQKNPVC